MKKVIYLAIMIFVTLCSKAQITYPSTDFAVAGDTFRISVAKPDSLNNYNFQLTGANYVWNYSQLEPQSQYIDQYITPNSSGYRISFITSCVAGGGTTPSCNSQWNSLSNLGHASPDSIVFGPFKFSNQVQLFEKTTSLLPQNVLGMSLSLNNITYPMAIKYTEPDTVYHFPLAYGNRDSCKSSYTIDLSNLGINFQYKVNAKRVNNVQGWGALTTPYGYFASTVQLYTTVVSFDTMTYNSSVIPIPSDTNIIFSWFATSKARPVMQVTALLTNGMLHYTDVEYIDTVRCITPLATFSKSPLTPYIDSATNYATVTFNNTSNNSNIFIWNFGDTASGNLNTSTAVNPTHNYDSAGVYKVTLIACNSVCSPLQCDTITLPVTIFDSSNVQANFTYLPLQPCTSDTVKFTNTSLNASAYSWSLGNGTTSTSKNPQVVYAAPGSYTVTLIASGDGVSDTTSNVIVVESPPVAIISVNGSTALCTGDTVILTASGGDTYHWSTGAVTAAIKVAASGSYAVTAYNSCGNSVSQPVTVTATAQVTPAISVTAMPGNTICAGNTVTLSAAITNGGNSPQYQWYKNGVFTGSTTSTYTALTPATNDSVWCVLTSSSACANPSAATSNKIKLTVKQPSTYNYSYHICQANSYNFNGHQLTQTGTYKDTLTSANGCDSIITLNLTVNANSTYAFNTAICAGTNYNFNGVSLTQAGTYHDTLASANGCDSIITLTLTINNNAVHTINAAVCAGSSYNFNSAPITLPGTYHDTLTSANGCDSIVTLNLSVNSIVTHNINATICTGSSYNFNGTTITQAGTYQDTLTSATGCDSIITLNLSVNSTLTHNINTAICAGSTYNFNGHQITQAGIYRDTLISASGCDSINILNLAVNNNSAFSLNQSICAGSSYNFNGRQLTQTGIYYDTLTSATGCDSIITLTLTANSNSAHNINAAICAGSNYNFNGTLLTQAGLYHDTLTNAGGCDSVITLTLTVNQNIIRILNNGICSGSSYNFNGTQLSQTGIYYDTLTAFTGCDSTVILHLTVATVLRDTATVVICSGDSFKLDNTFLTQSGMFSDTLTATGGCDSIFTVDLSVLPVIMDTQRRSICQGTLYNFGGQAIAIAGVYADTLISAHGCDSIVVLQLSVTPGTVSTITDTICAGQSYDFNGVMLNHEGSYADTLSGANTCDSIINLRLHVIQIELPTVILTGEDSLITDSIYASYQWILNNSAITGANTQLLVATQNGNYKVAVTGYNGCTDTSSVTTIIGLSIPQLNANIKTSVWPNPTSGQLNIYVVDTLHSALNIQLLNIFGTQVAEKEYPDLNGKTAATIDLSGLADGVYFLRLTAGNQTIITKVILNKTGNK